MKLHRVFDFEFQNRTMKIGKFLNNINGKDFIGHRSKFVYPFQCTVYSRYAENWTAHKLKQAFGFFMLTMWTFF